MTWAPASKAEVLQEVEGSLSGIDPVMRTLLEALLVDPYQAGLERLGAYEPVFVVARGHDRVVYFDDIEETFGTAIEANGRLTEARDYGALSFCLKEVAGLLTADAHACSPAAEPVAGTADDGHLGNKAQTTGATLSPPADRSAPQRLRALAQSECDQVVPLADVEQWMAGDLSVQDALLDALDRVSFRNRIQPALSDARRVEFMLDYLTYCLRHGPEEHTGGEGGNSRGEAALELARQFHLWWQMDGPAGQAVARIKDRLAEEFEIGPDIVRERIICLTLDHLFARNPKVHRFFGDWAGQPLLAEAYSRASA